MWKFAVVQFLASIASSLWPHVDDEIVKRKRLSTLIFFLCVVGIIATFFLTGCAGLPYIGEVFKGTANERIDSGPLYQYRAELELVISGKEFDGVTAAYLVGPLEIRIKSKFGLNRLQITSCGRQEVFRNVEKKWYGKISDNMTFNYVPSKYELEGPCPLYIEAYNKSALAAWAMIVFRNVEDLPGHIICNGQEKVFAGHSICQTKHSLEQAISFEVPIIKFRADEGCNMKALDEKTFKFWPSIGVCNASFYSGSKWHSMTAIGYERILVQQE